MLELVEILVTGRGIQGSCQGSGVSIETQFECDIPDEDIPRNATLKFVDVALARNVVVDVVVPDRGLIGAATFVRNANAAIESAPCTHSVLIYLLLEFDWKRAEVVSDWFDDEPRGPSRAGFCLAPLGVR